MATKKKSSARKSASASSKPTATSRKTASAAGRTSSRSSSRSVTRSGGSSSTRSGGRTAAQSRTASRAGAQAHTTTDHEEIRRWAEDRGAHPACVRGTGNKGDLGVLRLDFPGYTGEDKLQPISWGEWFEKFDERGLALLFQEKTARGQRSNFNKLVNRKTVEEKPKARGAH